MITTKRAYLIAIFLITMFLFYNTTLADKPDITESIKNNKKYTDNSGIILSVDLMEWCSFKPDKINDGYKICNSIVEINNTLKGNLNFQSAENRLKMDFINPEYIKNSQMDYYYSKDYNLVETINRSGDMNYEREWYNWRALESSDGLDSGEFGAFKISYEMEQYKSNFYNFTANFVGKSVEIDPTVSGCGSLDTQNAIYTLTDDILSTNASCMDITNDNITFNLDSYSITCDGCESTLFSGIEVVDSSFVTIGNGTIEDFGIGIDGIDSNNVIENIVIKADTSGYLNDEESPRLYGLLLTGVKINMTNISINKLIDTRGSVNVYGITMVSNNNQIWNSTVKGVDGGSSSEYGIYFESAALHNQIFNTVISNISNIEIGVFGNSLNNSFINCTYTNSSMSAGSGLLRKWYFDAQVNYTHNSTLVKGANITAWNITGDEHFSVLSGSDGKIETQYITEYTNTDGTRSYFSNYTMNASFGNWDVDIWSLNITDNKNQQFNISDNVNPDVNITKLTTQEGIKTITFNSTASDGNLQSCYYSIFNSTNEIDGTNENVSINCNQVNFAITSLFGTFNLTVYANDTVGNINSSTNEFTISEFLGGGGGGGTANFISTVALLKPEEDKSLYSKLDRAKIYKAILTACESKSIPCKLTVEEIIELQLDFEENYSLDITLEKIVLWLEQFNNNQIENVEILDNEVQKWGLVTAIVEIIETPFSVNPKVFDTFWFVASDTFKSKVRANKVLKSCTVEGEWSCSVDGSVSEITFKLDSFPPKWYTQSIETTLTYISIDDESVTQKVLIRAINYRKFLPIVIVIGIMGFVIVTFIYGKSLFKIGRK